MKRREWDAVWRKIVLPQVRKRFLRKVSGQFEKNDMVLDIGCGQGRTIHIFTELFSTIFIVGTDFSSEAIEKARNFDKRANYVICDVRCLPFRNSVFNIAYSEEVLEHVPGVDRLMRESYRILRKGGFFLTSVPNKLSPFYMIWRKILTFRNQWIYGDEHPYTPGSLENTVKLCGLIPTARFFFEMPYFLKFLDFYRNPFCVRVAIIARK